MKKVTTLIIFVMMLAGNSLSAPTTNPSCEYVAGYQAGYADSAAGKPSLYPPSIPPTTQPIPPTTQPIPPSYVASGTDLGPLLSNATAGQVIECDPKGTYTIGKPDGKGVSPTITASGVTLNGNGSKGLKMYAAPGSGTNVIVRAANFKVAGFVEITADAVAFRTYADSTIIRDSTFTTCVTALQTDGGTNAQLLASRIEKSKKVGVFIEASGSVIDHCYIGTSDTEYSVRYELGTSKVKFSGARLTDSRIVNPHLTANGKDAVGIRTGDDVYVSQCYITGDIRVGQVPKSPPWPNPTTFCNNTVIVGCTIDGIDDTIKGINVYQGSTVTANNTSVEATYAMVVDTNSILDAINCTHVVPAGKPVKPLIVSSSTGQHSEVGTKTIIK